MKQTISLIASMFLTACQGQGSLAEDSDSRGSAIQKIYIPGSNKPYEPDAPRDIQLYIEIEREYLVSDFTWSGDESENWKPRGGLSFNVNFDEMTPLPKYKEYDYDDYPRSLRVSIQMNPTDLVRRHADPSYENYSPSLYIGNKPVAGQIFGLDYRLNHWLGNPDGPTNEYFTFSEDGIPVVEIMCKEVMPVKAKPKSCSMQFFANVNSVQDVDSKYGVHVSIQMQYDLLPEWRQVWQSIDEFIQNRGEIVPFEEQI